MQNLPNHSGMVDPSLPTDEEEVFVFPLSFAQQRLWFLDQFIPGSPLYNIPGAVQFHGHLDQSILQQSFHHIICRHEALRTTFTLINGEPMQVIAPITEESCQRFYEFQGMNLSELSEFDCWSEAQRLTTENAQRPFNLQTGPLLRVMVLQIKPQVSILFVTIHHIIADGWSFGVFMQELMHLYDAIATDQTPKLPDLPIQYADFALWQREYLQGNSLQTKLAYWQQQLKGTLPVLEFPSLRSRPPVQSFRGGRQSFILSADLTAALKSFSRQENATLFMTLLAAFKTLLYRYTAQEDILIGSPIANRQRPELEGLIGFFVNTLVLRTNLSGNLTFRQLLTRVREVTLEADAHQDLPFEKLVEALQPQRELSRTPLFQVAFAIAPPMPNLESPWGYCPLEIDTGTAKFDLTLVIQERADSLMGAFEYSSDLFEADAIARLVAHFQMLLAALVINPDQPIGELPLLTTVEWQQLFSWNDTFTPYPNNTCIHELFTAQVEKTPDAIALIFTKSAGSQPPTTSQLTYRELNTKANQLAHYLQTLGVGTETLVGVCCERSHEMLIGILGILKAGAAYLPLDPAYPAERLAFMIEDAQVPVLLTQAALISGLPNHQAQVVPLDQAWEIIAQHPTQPPQIAITPDNLAYTIYTSGSTGKPKGVLLTHRGLCNLAIAQQQLFHVNAKSRVLQFASLSFDASTWEIVMALTAGATLVLAQRNLLLPGAPLLQLLRDQHITIVTLPPSALAVLPTEELPDLQTIIVAGEPCPPDLMNRWAINRQFFNAYGPTETTVCATVAQCYPSDQKLPIGRPIANTQIYLLDAHLQLVPIGVPGELYIGGVSLARGYLNQPELTAQKFIPNPFTQDHFSPSLYKTGDLARYLPNGTLEYLGRIDHQVKLRGFRIELGEIEAVLRQHPDVKETVVIVRVDQPGNQRLVAYIVSKLLPDRVTYHSECSAELPGFGIISLQTEDISTGGVCITGLPSSAIAPSLSLSLQLPGISEAQLFFGKIAWRNGNRAGIQFQLTPTQQVILNQSVKFLLETGGFLKVLQRTSVENLRSYLKQKLPDYMVPSSFVFLTAFPQTPNGKVDRKQLPVPDQMRSQTPNYVAPQTDIEQAIARIWQQVLQVQKVGLQDNFFDLGGHSLRMAQVHTQLQTFLGQKVSIVELFQYPTISALAQYLSQDTAQTPTLTESRDRGQKQKAAFQLQKQRMQRKKDNG